MGNLKDRSVSAVKWGAFSSFGRYFLQLISQIVIARLIGPTAFGEFGSALVVMVFAAFFAEVGFGWSLVNKKELVTDSDIRLAFTWQTLAGMLATLLILTFSAEIGAYFNSPNVGWIVAFTSISATLSALTSTAHNLMVRELRFKELGVIQLKSYFAGYTLLGVPMALLGMGVTALVYAWIAQSLIRLVLTYDAVRHSVVPLFWHADALKTFRFGVTVFATNIVNWTLSNLDRFIVGVRLPAHTMGLYTVAANLANTPNSLLIGAIQPALFSASAKIQDDRSRIRDAHSQVISIACGLVLPVFWVGAGCSQAAILVLYGEKWIESASILQVFLLAMPCYVVWGMSTPILWNLGRAKMECLLQIPVIGFMVVAMYIAAGIGVHAVASAAAVVLAMRALVILSQVAKQLGIGPLVYVKKFAVGLPTGIIGFSVSYAICNLLITRSPLLAMIVSPTLGAASAALLVWLVPGMRDKAVIDFLERLLAKRQART